MNNEGKTFTETIKYILMLLPLLALIWNAALMSSDIRQNRKDIEQIKATMETSIDRLTAQVADMNINITRLETKVDMLRKEEK